MINISTVRVAAELVTKTDHPLNIFLNILVEALARHSASMCSSRAPRSPLIRSSN